MTIQFQKAERTQRKFKIGLQGPSGSGKTLGALALAQQLVGPAGRIALADTEGGSASLYADRFNFDTIGMQPPYLSSSYKAVMKAAADAGYDILIIDSLSHQWAGEGGILSRKEAADARGGNSFTNWARFTPEQEEFKAAIVNAPIHIIGTLRTKQDYVLEAGSGGKQTPKKVGMAAIQREGMEYELDVNFELQMDHKAIASKDRFDLFPTTEMVDMLDGTVGTRLRAWMASGKAVPEPTKEPIATADQYEALRALAVNEEESKAIEKRIAKGMTVKQADKAIANMQSRKPAEIGAIA
jgi:hypothetical protein